MLSSQTGHSGAGKQSIKPLFFWHTVVVFFGHKLVIFFRPLNDTVISEFTAFVVYNTVNNENQMQKISDISNVFLLWELLK